MPQPRSYRSFEEFEREELRPYNQIRPISDVVEDLYVAEIEELDFEIPSLGARGRSEDEDDEDGDDGFDD